MRTIRIGTRNSKLALVQTLTVLKHIENQLGFNTEIIEIASVGDLRVDIPLTDSTQTGLFTSTLEEKLSNGVIDLAVHSLKDMPLKQPPGLSIAAFPARESTAEILVIAAGKHLPGKEVLPVRNGAVVGTGSPRRRSQLLSQRSDLNIELIRGNINTRLEKIAAGDYDAAVFAEAGLNRIALQDDRFILYKLDPTVFVSAPGQGALAMEMRDDDPDYNRISKKLNHPYTETCARAERSILEMFGGGCSLPLGATVNVDISSKQLGYHFNGYWNDGRESRWASMTTSSIQNGIITVYERLKRSDLRM